MAIDAIPRALGDFTPETRSIVAFDHDKAQTRATTSKLIDIVRREGA